VLAILASTEFHELLESIQAHMTITAEIEREAERLVRRHEDKARLAADESRRRQRRSASVTAPVRATRPPHWKIDPGFDPYITRARARRIGHAIRSSLRDRTYVPRRPVEFRIPKDDGNTRPLSIFQVADSAVSRLIFENLLQKNLPILSSRAYAYRKDLSAQDAVQYVRSEFSGRSRLFVAEYDFRSFFDTISHDHILKNLNDHPFLLTAVERHVVEAFLRTQASFATSYHPVSGDIRTAGVPQGTSISLFLANVAAWELDRSLEKCGVGFTRYADDTLIWAPDYGSICNAVELLQSHAESMGVSINLDKSPGIRLLALAPDSAEIKPAKTLDYLGYALGLDSATIKARSVDKVCDHLERLLYWNLLHEPLHGTQNLGQLKASVDRDYYTFLSQARRYLYGDLSERSIQRFQRGDIPLRRFKGVMAAYPLIDDTPQLTELDGWLATRTYLTLRRRAALLSAAGAGALPAPHGMSKSDFLQASAASFTTGEKIDLRLPSFRRVAHVVRRAAAMYGAGAVGKSRPYGY
jgi:RNA-directed DNA polymerase